jgi:hypothetical protein
MRYLALLPLLALAACATLSEDQCRQGDWQAIGQADGANGRTPDYLAKHAKACADFGIVPDAALWEKGRRQGLPLYCRPARAWDEGADGRRLSPVCPPEELAELQRANRDGLIYHRIGEDIAEAEREIGRITAELASLPADDPSRSALFAERASLRLEIVTLRAERALYRY